MPIDAEAVAGLIVNSPVDSIEPPLGTGDRERIARQRDVSRRRGEPPMTLWPPSWIPPAGAVMSIAPLPSEIRLPIDDVGEPDAGSAATRTGNR